MSHSTKGSVEFGYTHRKGYIYVCLGTSYYSHNSARMLLTAITCLLMQLLLVESWMTQSVHSLCFNLAVTLHSRPGQPWFEVQGSVDQKPFLQYDSDSNKVKPWGFLGETVNATKAWTELTQMLREVGQELRMILPVITPENNRSKGPPTLQAKTCCQREAEGCTGAFWQFSFNRKAALLFDTMNMNWTVIDPEARGIKEDWKDNRELVEYFRKMSVGDCSHSLGEFLEHWEKMPEPTGN
uniref:MHC class I-like antigen recognition-like domain-containing protein n=1 Tax=Rhinolophus ferrumequinum TaxID=59479 RepID=A0A671FIZ6_RHIFE